MSKSKVLQNIQDLFRKICDIILYTIVILKSLEGRIVEILVCEVLLSGFEKGSIQDHHRTF